MHMNKLIEFLQTLLGSNSLQKRSFSSIRSKVSQWSSGTYPLYADVPDIIEFSYEFWARVTDIYRHTSKDLHERAIRVWWADGEFVLTESVRGSERDVVMPKQTVTVRFDPVGTDRFDRVILVDSTIYAKKTMQAVDVAKVKRVEVQFLFNMHTHPPVKDPRTGAPSYPFFSAVDIRGFLRTPSAVTGLVTDKLWLLIKTSKTQSPGVDLQDYMITSEYLRDTLRLKVFCGTFGKSVVVLQPGYGEDISSDTTP